MSKEPQDEFIVHTKQYGISQKEFATEAMARLGELVGDMRELGEAGGLSKDQIREVWQTAFSLMSGK